MSAPKSRTIPALLDELADKHPAQEALVGLGQRHTYASLRDEVRSIAAGLFALGVRKGNKVAILMGNRPEWVVADLATCSLGAVMVALNTWTTQRELEFALKASDASVLVTSGAYLKQDYLAMLAEISPRSARLPNLREIVLVAHAGGDGCRAWSDVAQLGAGVCREVLEAAAAAVRPTDIAYLLFTSGTTSTPKGVQIRHDGLIENMWNIGERQRVTGRDRLWLAVSLFWGLGCENALFNVLTHGACLVLQHNFDAGEALELIARERCSLFYGTPNMALALYEHPARASLDLSSLRSGVTLGTPEQIMRVISLGAKQICNVYGLTETYGNSHVIDSDDPLELRLNSVGKALPGVETRIISPETGRSCPPGAMGEIQVRGYVTPGYLDDPERTREVIGADGWFKTGDLGSLDAQGYLYFRGRLKEMVKTGGINVAPIEVESVLLEHPAVQVAHCTGIPDPVRDEVLVAVIVLKPGAAASEEELREHCRRAMAAYKVPRHYRIVQESELPLTSTGKVKKNALATTFFRVS